MRSWLIFLAALALSDPAALHTQPTGNDPAVLRMRAADAVAVMQQLRSASDVFNSAFLAEVPPTRLAGMIAQLEAQHGKLLSAENLVQTGPSMANLTLVFERARASAAMVLEPVPPRRIAGMRITNVVAQGNIAPITPLFTPSAPGGIAPRPPFRLQFSQHRISPPISRRCPVSQASALPGWAACSAVR